MPLRRLTRQGLGSSLPPMKTRAFVIPCLTLTLILGGIIRSRTVSSASAPPQSNHNATRADFDQYMKDLSNWGRWGKDDQLGAVNLITPAKRRQALATVKEGVSISMARTGDLEKSVDNPEPIVRKMVRVGVGQPTTGTGGTADTFFISYHGYIHTHMDSLCHFLYEGKCITAIPRTKSPKTERRRTAFINYQERLHHARNSDGYSEAQGRGLSRTGNPHLSGRSRRLGKAGASQGWAGRCRLHSHRAFRETRRQGPVAD